MLHLSRALEPKLSARVLERPKYGIPKNAESQLMGASFDQPSVDELRRESERNRAKLSATVEQLAARVSDTVQDTKARLSPDNIKKDVKEYFRDSGDQLFHTLQRKASENPLQAAAIGVGLAIPLWSFLKKMPAPVWLVGAGLLLSQKGVRAKSQELMDEAAHRLSGLGERASEITTDLHDSARDALKNASAAVSEANTSVSEAAQAAKNSMSGATSQAKSTLVSAVGDAKEAVQQVADAGVDATTKVYASVKNAAVGGSEKSRAAMSGFVEQNPVLIGGIGLAIGALVAASLPKSIAENSLFGTTSDEAKRKAAQTVSDGVQRVKDVAGGIAADVAAAAGTEGMNTDGVKLAVSGFADQFKTVAEAGIKAASGGPRAPASQSSSS